MTVRLRVHGHISEFFPGKSSTHEIEIPKKTTIRDLLLDMGVNPQLVPIAIVNGRRSSISDEVCDGDEVLLMSPVAGG